MNEMEKRWEEASKKWKESCEQRDKAMAKFDAATKSFTHTISNLVDASKHDSNEPIKAYGTGPDGNPVVIKSRRHTMNIRNLLYGKGL